MKIIIDTREQRPFAFLGQNGDIETERGTLSLGDYSLAGLTDRVAVERKSLADLVTGLGKERERFQRELMSGRAGSLRRGGGKLMAGLGGRQVQIKAFSGLWHGVCFVLHGKASCALSLCREQGERRGRHGRISSSVPQGQGA